MTHMTEIRWHGRGGQGAKTAATLLAEVACSEGKYSQGFPEYGPERMGAPMKGYTRISDAPIRVHSGINNPDVVIVLDETLFAVVDILEGLKENGTLIVNSPCGPGEIRQKYQVKGRKVFTIEATLISIQELKKDMPNTPLLGALAKILGEPNLDALITDLKKKFSKHFTPEMVEANVKAVKRAFEEVKGE